MKFRFLLVATLSALFIPSVVFADVIVCDFDGDEILRYDDEGNFLGTIVEAGSGPLDGPSAVEIGPDGLLYVASFNNDAIFRYSYPCGAFLGNFAIGGNLQEVRDLTFGPDGQLWVADANEIKRFDAATGQFLGVIVFINSINDDFQKMRFEPTSNDLFVSFQGFFGASFSTIARLSFDFDPEVFIEEVYQIDFGGGTEAFAFGPGLGAEGDLFISSSASDGSIERYDLLSGDFLQTFSFIAPDGSLDMEIGPDSDFFLQSLTGEGENRIDRYDGTTGLFSEVFIGDLPSAPFEFDFVENPIVLGDVNLDGCVDLLDVQPLVALLTSGKFQAEADVNGDGVVNLLDVGPFVDLLTG